MGTHVRTKGFIVGLSSNFIVSAVIAYLTNSTRVATIAFGIGLALLIVAAFIGKKHKLETVTSFRAPSINQDTKQESSPHINAPINISIGNSSSTAAAAAPTPALEPETKDEPRCNIRFTGVSQQQMRPTSVLSPYAGQSIPYLVASFENQHSQGQKLRIPTVTARAIFKHADGHTIADVPHVAWTPNHKYATLKANLPQHLVLLFLQGDTLFCRSIEDVYISLGARRIKPPKHRDYVIGEPVASIEVQLLTDDEELYNRVLPFSDQDEDNPLPQFTGTAD